MPDFFSAPEKQVPKLCSSIHIARIKSGDFILTFLYQDKVEDEKGKNEVLNSVLLERIFLDKEHAKQLTDRLSEFLKKDEN